MDATSPPRPELSVVVASFCGEASLRRALTSIMPQANGGEVIAATTLAEDGIARLKNQFPAVEFVSAPESATVFQLRSLGLLQARGELMVLTEDHCAATPGWLAAYRQAYRHGHVVMGGPVTGDPNSGVYGWALFLCEYAPLLPPMPGGAAQVLSGVNAAYDRRALMSCLPAWQHGFFENEVHDALRKQGHALQLVGDAVLCSHLNLPLPEALGHFRTGGSRFGSYRSASWGLLRRALWPLAAPAVMLILLMRIVRSVWQRCPRRSWRLVISLPCVLCLLGAWSIGEVLAPLFGPRPAGH